MNSNSKQTKQSVTGTDTFVGTNLATLFLGAIFGADVGAMMDAGDTAAAVCEDRRTSNGNYELGVKKSLAGTFTRTSMGLEEPAKVFGLFPTAPAPSPRLAA